ncbi:glycosyltransferase family 2 protein [Brevibacillus sp. SYSU BS000544]|uniref:glycosyltransferase family 2 protein n=1 Tax=Brevibacillus sp. SYSU BS000544 TaxID=3416443 RepID=UPI003CE513F5
MDQLLDEIKVTVVIPTYNRCDMITKAITSVQNQTMKEWKLLIIDDGSVDGTEEVVSDITCEDQRISYYRMPVNSGQAHALNTALQMVTTKYMIQLDSDDWLENHTLERLVTAMENQPETTAMAYGNYTVWSPRKKFVERLRPFLNQHKYEFISYGPTLCPRFYRTDCLRAVGGWDTHDKYGGRFVEDRRIMYKLLGNYDFLWLDERLYNINRMVNKNSQLTRHVQACNEVKREAILATLHNWGGEYVPQFSKFRGGWLKTELIPKQRLLNLSRRKARRRVKMKLLRQRRLRGLRKTQQRKEIRPVGKIRPVRKKRGIRKLLLTRRLRKSEKSQRSQRFPGMIRSSKRTVRRRAKKRTG